MTRDELRAEIARLDPIGTPAWMALIDAYAEVEYTRGFEDACEDHTGSRTAWVTAMGSDDDDTR